VQISAPPPKCPEKVRDGGSAIASTRGACAPQILLRYSFLSAESPEVTLRVEPKVTGDPEEKKNKRDNGESMTPP
jgi:hypothetical protein